MVPGINSVRLLAKLPVPVPLVVGLSDVVGFCEVPQQTPLAVMSAPPSFEIYPPDLAVVNVISDITGSG